MGMLDHSHLFQLNTEKIECNQIWNKLSLIMVQIYFNTAISLPAGAAGFPTSVFGTIGPLSCHPLSQ